MNILRKPWTWKLETGDIVNRFPICNKKRLNKLTTKIVTTFKIYNVFFLSHEDTWKICEKEWWHTFLKTNFLLLMVLNICFSTYVKLFNRYLDIKLNFYKQDILINFIKKVFHPFVFTGNINLCIYKKTTDIVSTSWHQYKARNISFFIIPIRKIFIHILKRKLQPLSNLWK